MNLKDTIFGVGQLADNPAFHERPKEALKAAERILANFMNMLQVPADQPADKLVSALYEHDQRYRALLHFALQAAEVVDQAVACEVAGAEQLMHLYRTLELTASADVHPEAGMTAYLISGRLSGSVDDSVDIIIANSLEEAQAAFKAQHLDIWAEDQVSALDKGSVDDHGGDEEDEEEGDPEYFLVCDDVIGTVDSQGRIVRR